MQTVSEAAFAGMSFAAFLQVLVDVVARYAATRPVATTVGDRSRVEPRSWAILVAGASRWRQPLAAPGLGRHSPTFALEVLKAHIGSQSEGTANRRA